MNKINKKTFLKQLCLLPFCRSLIKSEEKLYKSDFVRGDCGWNNHKQIAEEVEFSIYHNITTKDGNFTFDLYTPRGGWRKMTI